MLDLLRTWNNYLLKTIRFSLIIVTIIVIGAMFLQVVNRYFLSWPIYGLDEITGHMAVWLYMLGAAYGAAINDHIRADLLEVLKVPRKAHYYIMLLANLFSIGISGTVMVWGITYVKWSMGRNEMTPNLHMPTYWFQSAIVVGTALMCLFFIKEFVGNLLYKKVYTDPTTEGKSTWEH